MKRAITKELCENINRHLSSPRRALMLPAGTALEGVGRPWPPPRAPEPGDFLLDPDRAVVVAGLVGEAAALSRQ